MVDEKVIVAVEFKDKGVEKGIKNLQRAMSGGAGGLRSQATGMAANLIGKSAGGGASGAESLGKLSLIAGGVVALVAIFAKASAAFGAVLDILATALTMFFKPFGDFLAMLLMPLAIMLLKLSIWFMKTFGPPLMELGQTIGNIFSGLGEAFSALVSGDIGTFLSILWNQVIIPWFTAILNFNISWGQLLWDILIGILKIQFNFYTGLGKWLWDTLTGIVKTGFDTLKGIGQWIYDVLTGKIDPIDWGFNVLKGLGQWIKDKIMEMFFGGGGGGEPTGTPPSAGSNRSSMWKSPVTPYDKWESNNQGTSSAFNDFIYRPGEGIKSFSPDDTVVGFKGSMPGGGITINVSGSVYGDIEELASRLANEIRMQNSTLMR